MKKLTRSEAALAVARDIGGVRELAKNLLGCGLPEVVFDIFDCAALNKDGSVNFEQTESDIKNAQRLAEQLFGQKDVETVVGLLERIFDEE